jgi:trimeric autotransporter adhesin
MSSNDDNKCSESQTLTTTGVRGITFRPVCLLITLLLIVANAVSATGQNKNIVILAPHPDDEGLCCAGIIYNALQQGNNVTIVVVTNGDYEGGVSTGLTREGETVSGMSVLGLSEQQIIFMGYGDEALQGLYQSTSPSTIIASPAGQTQTYATRGLGGVSYHQYLFGTPGQYNRQTILGDMEAMLQNLQPTDIYTTGLWDDHPDHESTFNFVVEALLDLRRQGVPLSTKVHETFIHAPCSSCGVPSNLAYVWPGAGTGVTPRFMPDQPYPEPYYLSNIWPNGNNTPYSWNQIERIPLPAPMQDPNQATNLKASVIANYVSQGGSDRNGFLQAFVKKDEFFWVHDFNTNIAGLATVTDSSESPDTGQLGTSAIDGFVEGYPGYQNWEWVTQGQLAGAWINLTWPTPVTISQVVLYNRQTLAEDVQSGHLTFSDGTTVPVGQLPINGNPYLVSFPPKTVTSMQFTVDSAVGQAIGLTEIEVYGSIAGNTINDPQFFQGIMTSAPYSTDTYGQLLTPTITDAQTTNLNVVAFDVDAQPLNYAWVADSGVITGSGPNASFSPPVVSAPTIVTTTVTVIDGQGGTAQTSGFITVTPSNTSGIAVSSLSFNPNNVQSGSIALATVTLNNVAPQGAVVALSSSNTAVATVPATVTVAPGSNSAVFPVSTVYVASTVSVTISASLGGVTQVSSLNVLQPPVIVSSVTFNPPTVGGGNPSTGTVSLSSPAQGNAVITLTNGSPSIITIPASVTIPSGSTSVTFPVTTHPVSAGTSVAISAKFVGQTTNVTLRVAPYVPPNLATSATVTVSSENVTTQQQGIKAIDGIVDGAPGDSTKEWATLGQLAGAWLQLTWDLPVTTSQVVLYDRPNLTENVTSATLSFSDGSTVPVGALPNDGSPLTVTFSPKTTTSMQFTVNTAVGQNIGLAEIAVIGTITQASTINAVSITPAWVTGGNVSTGTVTLNGVAPTGGTVVNLSSSDTSSATVPSSVTVPAGSLTASFPITTYSVTSNTQVSVSGTYNGTQSGLLTVVPVGVATLSVNPTMVQGGSATSTGIVSLTGPAPPSGAVITLTSNNSGAASPPATITIPAGSTSGTFTVTTASVPAIVQAGISAIYNGTQTTSLFVTPVISGGGMQQFAVDNFTRADGPLGTNWSTTIESPSVPSITNQQVQSPWVYSTTLYYGGVNWPADQYAQVQVLQSNGGSSGPAVRMSSNAYYAGTVGSFGSGNADVYIILKSGGNRSIIASSNTATVMANDYLQLTVQGTAVTLTDVTQSETLLTVTDSTLMAGYPGICVGSGGIVANWSAGLNTMPSVLQSVASDNFNRPNSPNLGPNWSVGPGYYPIQIVNTQIESDGQGQPPGQGHGKEYYTASTFPSDQWSQAQVIQSTNDVNGALLRYQGTADTHYVGFVSMLGAPGTCSVSIDSDTNGAPTVLASDSQNCSVSPGDYVRLQAQGPLLTYVDVTTGALLLTVLDSGISGGSPGWSLNPVGGTPIAASWSGGQFWAPSQVSLSSLSLSQNSVAGGGSLVGTVMLNGPAPSGGAVVTLTSSNTIAAQVPGSVTVAAGATIATFTVGTAGAVSDTALTISGTYGTTQSTSLTVTATKYTITGTISGPGGPGATVNLSGALSTTTTADGAGNYTFTALANGSYTVTPSNGSYTFTPSSQTTTISNANISAFNFSSLGSTYSLSGTISGTGGPGATVSLTGASSATTTADGTGNYTFTGLVNGSYTVTPSNGSYIFAPSSQSANVNSANVSAVNFSSLAVASVILSPSSVIGGSSSTGTVTLSAPAPASGAAVVLSSSNTAAAQVPGSVTVNAGATTATFTVTSSPVAANASLSIVATLGTTQNAGFTVTAPAPSSVSLSPSSVIGGSSSTGTVTLNGPAPVGGAVVTLSSSNPAAAQVPASVTVAANATSATFTVTTAPVSTNAAVSISATYGSSQSSSLSVTAAVLSSVNVNPTSVTGGSSSTGTVTLNGPAPAGGAVVTLSSSNTAAAQTPASVTVAANATTALFTITTTPVSTNTSLTISATYVSTQSTSFTVNAPVASSVTVNPTSVPGGAPSIGTVTLNGPAPAGGAVFALSSSNTAAAQVPANVTVAANATTATFTITTSVVSTTTAATISATHGATQTASLTVMTGSLSTVTLNPASVLGGTSSTGTVTLAAAAPGGGAVITLSSSNTAAAQVPASVTVAAGATTATFTVTTTPVASTTTATISGTYGATRTGSLTVTPPTLSGNGNAVALSPASVVGGNSSTGTVRLTGPAPAGGSVVTLSSSNTAAAQVPASVTVPAGATTATFTVTTTPVASNATVTITAVYGVTRTATLTVTPASLSAVTLSPTSVIGGTSSTGTVTLNGPAPAAGAVVTLSSNNTADAQVPASVSVGAGATTATFGITTTPVASNASVTISGTYGTTRTATLTVTAATLTSVTLNPTSVIGATSSTGTVTLSGPAPAAGAVVTLSSSNTAAATVPASVTVAPSATTATFIVTTKPVTANTNVTITATRGTAHTATLTVQTPVVSLLSLNPTTVKGGSPSTGTVTISGPAPSGGTVVTLSSSSTAVATVPASVTVAAGNTTATFTVTTKTVSNSTSVTVSATKGATQTANLTVTI